MKKERLEEYFCFLDQVRDSGIINMFGAAPVLQEAYPELSLKDARKVLSKWMSSFNERHRKKKGN